MESKLKSASYTPLYPNMYSQISSSYSSTFSSVSIVKRAVISIALIFSGFILCFVLIESATLFYTPSLPSSFSFENKNLINSRFFNDYEYEYESMDDMIDIDDIDDIDNDDDIQRSLNLYYKFGYVSRFWKVKTETITTYMTQFENNDDDENNDDEGNLDMVTTINIPKTNNEDQEILMTEITSQEVLIEEEYIEELMESAMDESTSNTNIDITEESMEEDFELYEEDSLEESYDMTFLKEFIGEITEDIDDELTNENSD